MIIKIITCHDVYNPGASLQAYALQTYLNGLDHDVQIIDYKPEYLSRHYRLLVVNNEKYRKPVIREAYIMLKLPSRLLRLFSRKKRVFDSFRREYLMLTKHKYRSFKELQDNCPVADIYIAGSDQIWNPVFQNGRDPAFFLRFVDEKSKRVSYAASIAADSIDTEDRQRLHEWLLGFRHVSVREQSAVQLLSSLDVNAVQVCDPIFLLRKEYWNRIARLPKEKGYIFLYDFDGSEETIELAKALAKNMRKEIISFLPTSDRHIELVNSGPREFLGLIMNSSLVISNSFHATAFSILFLKDFYVVPRKEKINVRLTDLLERLDLKDRFIQNSNDIYTNRMINWDKIRRIIDQEVEKSKNYLNYVICERNRESRHDT